jgi:hypothetical protein
VVVSEDRIGSRMLISSREPTKFPGSTRSGSGKYGCRTINLLQQCTPRVVRYWQTLFLVVSISGVKTLGLTFSGCTWQWRFFSRFLVEDIVWRLDVLEGENLRSNQVG